jgi:hypothetical protein
MSARQLQIVAATGCPDEDAAAIETLMNAWWKERRDYPIAYLAALDPALFAELACAQRDALALLCSFDDLSPADVIARYQPPA